MVLDPFSGAVSSKEWVICLKFFVFSENTFFIILFILYYLFYIIYFYYIIYYSGNVSHKWDKWNELI